MFLHCAFLSKKKAEILFKIQEKKGGFKVLAGGSFFNPSLGFHRKKTLDGGVREEITIFCFVDKFGDSLVLFIGKSISIHEEGKYVWMYIFFAESIEFRSRCLETFSFLF